MRDALPISFSRPLIPKVIDGSKDQTRRIIPASWWRCLTPEDFGPDGDADPGEYCPYGGPGGKLWVREDHRILARSGDRVRIRYEADRSERWVTLTEREVALLDARRSPLSKPQPGRFMYRSCSRILLAVREIRVERLQSITEEDARAEGVEPSMCPERWSAYDPETDGYPEFDVRPDRPGLESIRYHPPRPLGTARESFERLWGAINGWSGPKSWEANPWVWVVGFSVAEVKP